MELLIMSDLLPPSDTFSPPSSPLRPLLSPSDEDSDEFDFSRHLPLNLTLPAADELFSGGLIRPLHPHPSLIPTPKPISPKDPNPNPNPKPPPRHRPTRSLSPLRVSEFALHQSESSKSSSSSSSSSSSPSKWKLKDFLLFRSNSEGSERRRTKAIDDPINKCSSVSSALFACIGTTYDNDSSFRYAIGEGEGSHQLRYYRAIEDAKKNSKTTSLQYKQRLLDCVGLNSASNDDHRRREVSTGVGRCFSL